MNLESLDNLQRRSLATLTGPKYKVPEGIANAMIQVDRRKFVPDGYTGDPLAIEKTVELEGEASISTQQVVAHLLQMADINPDNKILDVGTGSGYLAAVEARLAEPDGTVISVDVDLRLTNEARQRVARLDIPNLTILYSQNITQIGDMYGHFDRIICSVGVAAPKVNLLTDLLVEGGICVVPVSLSKLRPKDCRLDSYVKEGLFERTSDSKDNYTFYTAQGMLGWD